MCGRGLLKEIAATHRNGTGGRAQIELGGSPSNTNRGVQPTCIRLRACRSDRKVRCVVVVSSRRSRSHIGPGRCVAHKIQVGGSPYNTNRGVQPTCVEADAELGYFGVLSCVRLMCAAMCAQSAVWHVCVGCRVVLRASDGLGTASRPPVRVCRSSERCASRYETAGPA